MKIELNEEQLEIIRMALSNAIEKFVGVSEAQANYIQNIDSGMTEIEAKKNFLIDNKREWEFYVKKKKNGLFILYDQLFSSPASSKRYERR